MCRSCLLSAQKLQIFADCNNVCSEMNHINLLQVRSALHTVLRQKAPRDCLFILYDAPEVLARDLDPDLRAYLKKCRKLDYRRDSMFWARLR